MDVTTDKAVTECFHGVGQYIPADCLHNIFCKLRPVTFNAFPFFSVAGAFVGDRVTTKLVLFDLRLYIGKSPAGRKLNKQLESFTNNLETSSETLYGFDVSYRMEDTIEWLKTMN